MPSKSSTAAYYDPLADVEKGFTAGMKVVEEEEQEIIVDHRKALLIKCLFDALLVFYVLFYTGMVAYSVRVADNWWDPWPGVVLYQCFLIVTIFMIPKAKELYVKAYATKRPQASSGSDDLSAKLLAPEK